MISRKRRFIISLSVLLVTGFIATSLVSYFVAHDSLVDQIAENTLPLTSDNIYSEIQQDLLRPIFISSLMAQDTFVRDWAIDGEGDPNRIVRYLKEIKERYGAVTAFYVSENTRIYYRWSGVHRVVEENNPRDVWYFRVRDMTKDYEINVDVDEVNHDAVTIFINYRVYDYEGNYIGATGVGLSVNAVGKLLEVYQNRYGRRVYFTDRQGNVKLRSSGYDGPANIRDTKGLGPLVTQILSTPGGSYTYMRDGNTVYLNTRLVPEFGWVLLVEEEEDLSESRLLHTLLGNLLVCLAITGVVLLLANLTIGGYQRRLEEMATVDKLTGLSNRQVVDAMVGRIEAESEPGRGTCFRLRVPMTAARTTPGATALPPSPTDGPIHLVTGHEPTAEAIRLALANSRIERIATGDLTSYTGPVRPGGLIVLDDEVLLSGNESPQELAARIDRATPGASVLLLERSDRLGRIQDPRLRLAPDPQAGLPHAAWRRNWTPAARLRTAPRPRNPRRNRTGAPLPRCSWPKTTRSTRR